MKIIDRITRKRDGALLVIFENRNGDLIGETYGKGTRKPGSWDSRALFTGKDACEFRVREYFGFL